MIYMAFRNIRIEVLALDEAKEELVNDLYVRPCDLKHWLIFLGVKCLTLWIHRRWNWSEKIFAEHVDYFWVHCVRDNLTIICDIVE